PHGNAACDAPRRYGARRTRSVPECIPTPSVGTRRAIPVGNDHIRRRFVMSRRWFPWMTSGLLLIGILGVRGLGSPQADPVQDPRAVLFFDHDRVKAGFEKGGTLFKRPNYQVHTSFRDKGGEAEIHTRNTDIFHIQEGKATLVLGGALESPREVEPDEI